MVGNLVPSPNIRADSAEDQNQDSHKKNSEASTR